MKTFKQFLENPDLTKTKKPVAFTAADAHTFACWNTFQLIDLGSATTHVELFAQLKLINDAVSKRSADNQGKALATQLSKFPDIAVTGSYEDFLTFISNPSLKIPTFGSPRDFIREKFAPVTGRIWTVSKVISIWKDSWSELSNQVFESTLDVVRYFGGKVEEYAFDNALPQYSDKLDYDKRTNTYDEVKAIVGGKKPVVVKKDRYADIIHMMSPEQKQILKTVTADTPYSKVHAIADKLGITVAQLRQLSSMTEAVKFDAKDGVGAVPYNQEIDYRGFKREMTPDQFLELAIPMDGSREDAITINFLKDAIKSGKGFGQPFFNVEWNADRSSWQITSHDGRHRAAALKELYGPKVKMEVHLFPRGMRARDLTPEMKAAPLMKELSESVAPAGLTFTTAKERGEDEGNDLWVIRALLGGKEVGVARLIPARDADYRQAGDNDLSIEWLEVNKKYQRQGIGTKLYQRVIRFAKKQGGKFLYSGDVSDDAMAVRKILFGDIDPYKMKLSDVRI
jgi:GNAT superfamily N-acetyltransferase